VRAHNGQDFDPIKESWLWSERNLYLQKMQGQNTPAYDLYLYNKLFDVALDMGKKNLPELQIPK